MQSIRLIPVWGSEFVKEVFKVPLKFRLCDVGRYWDFRSETFLPVCPHQVHTPTSFLMSYEELSSENA
jgi:hypothetical protein